MLGIVGGVEAGAKDKVVARPLLFGAGAAFFGDPCVYMAQSGPWNGLQTMRSGRVQHGP